VNHQRRKLLVYSLAAAGILSAPAARVYGTPALRVENVTRLYPVKVGRIVSPSTSTEVRQAVMAWPGRIAVGGARYSMGGQIGIDGGLHIDMRRMNGLVWLDPQGMVARVQAGMRWRDLQDHLDPLNLSVRTMQSYSNFTVGGSVSVNAHGRYVGHGPVAHSVRALQLVLANGDLVEASRTQNVDLFRAALGGYGALGVITEVELWVDGNSRIERSIDKVSLRDYPAYFERKVKAHQAILLHNADLLPPLFDEAMAVNWSVTHKPVTEAQRLVPRGLDYTLEQGVIWALTSLPNGDKLQRKVVRPALLGKPAVVWRNYEASLDAASLEPRSREASTYVLQEYFVPIRHFVSFAQHLGRIVRRHQARVLNVSVRHSPADEDAVMAWAREEVFSFVVYFKQGVDPAAIERVGDWTRELIAAALHHEGSYYLPYQRHATGAQFDAAYPQKASFQKIKARFDPAGRMTNELWNQYL
jgi:FAD/FMN-containing dehydrogenase